MNLTSVIISIGLTSLLALSIMQLTRTGNSSAKHLENKVEVALTKSYLLNVFNNPEQCRQAFRDESDASAQIHPTTSIPVANELKSLVITSAGSFKTILKEGEKFVPGLSVTNLTLNYQRDGSNNPIYYDNNPVAGQRLNMIELVYEIQVENDLATGSKFISNASSPIRLNLVSDMGTNEIVGCNSFQATTSWVRVGDAGRNYSVASGSCPQAGIITRGGVDLSPSGICSDSGYTNALGPCRSLTGAANTFIEGNIGSNTGGGCGPLGDQWILTCIHGGGAAPAFSANVEILCI